MSTLRAGSYTAFWNNQNVTTGLISSKANVGRTSEQIIVYVKANASNTFTILVAHHGSLTSEGNLADAATPPVDALFHPLSYIGTACTITCDSNGYAAFLIPDFAPEWIAIKAGGNYSGVTAGYEVTGDND